jgi:uncharacterized protein (TIGR00375 family)
MIFAVDFHIHSKYSRAVSQQMNLENIGHWAEIKGVKVIGTGDFTHPKWLEDIKNKLEPAESGLFKLKLEKSETRFILTSEISCIYSKNGRVRKIHILILAPSINTVEKINNRLREIGNLGSDGRPILGLDVQDLVKIVLDSDKNCLIIPAHIWTPWFSMFGSKSGFDSLDECFGKYTKYIYAIETGLCSNPTMNWRLSQLDKVNLVSNSDAHSLSKIGREANMFNTNLSYNGIVNVLKSKTPSTKKKFLYTIEFFPEEGKYHYDGHRLCKISLHPTKTKKYKNICPKCGNPLIIGVLNRVEKLADRAEGFLPKNLVPFKSLIPLNEVIAESIGVSLSSKEVTKYYNSLIKNIGNEFKILLESKKEEIGNYSSLKIADAILKMRQGKVSIKPGYDGVYGKIRITSKKYNKKIFKNNK